MTTGEQASANAVNYQRCFNTGYCLQAYSQIGYCVKSGKAPLQVCCSHCEQVATAGQPHF